MAYCGAIGSVHVLSLLSTDLFDEAQENPFLLTAAAGTGAANAELPLDDAPHCGQLQYSPGRTAQSVAGSSPLRSILKRQASVDSTASTAASAADYVDQQPPEDETAVENRVVQTDSELHKLLYSLTRFGLATDAGAASAAAPPAPSASTVSLSKHRGVSFASPAPWQQQKQQEQQQPSGRKRRGLAKRVGDAGSRGSVTYATVKNLLRGGCGASGDASPSRTARRTAPDFRRKSMGTVSSWLKRRDKFARPTILTDAYHRVSDMKLGTKPMGPAIKHLAFPDLWGPVEDREEADPGMPSPRGQLRRQSLVSLETLDKIGTRAACPVHLLVEAAPDFSHVRARVDSYNRVRSPSRGLRRPSAWLPPSAVTSADGGDEDEDGGDEDEDERTGGFRFADGGF